MRKVLLSILLVLLTYVAVSQNHATIKFEIWGKQIYRIDTKTNITDKWYPYSVTAMCANCIGTNADGFIYGPAPTADQHQPCSIDIPVSTKQGFFRLYTLPENTNGVIWPTSNSTNVPFILIPPAL